MAGHRGHASSPPDATLEFQMELAKEMRGRFVGPMPPQQFLDEFLPTTTPALPEVTPDAFSSANRRVERDMYSPFIGGIGHFAPSTVAVDTSNAQDGAKLGHHLLKPDVSIYWKGNSPGDKQRKARTDFSLMEIHVEFKRDDADESFDDEAGRGQPTTRQNFEKNTWNGRRQRGQITSYALAQFSSQFRCFAFSLFISRKFARFIRWDRAGAVVSERFDYTQDPLLLATFLWRFSHSSPEERGIDTSVTLASFDDRPEDESRIRRILGLEKSVPIYRYEVPDDDQSRQERCANEGELDSLAPYYYYGPMPPCPKWSLIGRSTRSLPVVDLGKEDDDKAHVYLKDAWRIDSPRIEKEGDIYRSLHAAKVPRIAPFERGNDVVSHGYETQTQRFTSSIWFHMSIELTGHIHYRMVLGIVGKALTSFSSTKELVSTVRDALIAHTHAYEDAGILHRDISPANMVATFDGGYLIDWDLCKRLWVAKSSDGGKGDTDEFDHSPRRRDRTGTWQFMSAMILLDRGKVQGRVDDLESFLHTLSWIAIRFVDNIMTDDDRSSHLKEVFDEVAFRNNILSGGEQKRLRLLVGWYIPVTLHFKKPSPLLQLLKAIAEVFKWRYTEISEEDRENYAALIVTLIPGTPTYTAYTSSSPVHKHDLAMMKLGDASWLLDTLNHSLLPDSPWPVDDAASLAWLPVDSMAPPVVQSRHLSAARSSEVARAATYASTSSSQSHASSKRGRPESPHDEQAKRPRVD